MNGVSLERSDHIDHETTLIVMAGKMGSFFTESGRGSSLGVATPKWELVAILR